MGTGISTEKLTELESHNVYVVLQIYPDETNENLNITSKVNALKVFFHRSEAIEFASDKPNLIIKESLLSRYFIC